MAHANITPANLAGTQTTIALTEFKLAYLDALSGYTLPEMVALGAVETSSALVDRYPINVGDPVFQELVAENPEYRQLGEIFFEMATKRYASAVIENAARLRTAEWALRGWADQPQRFAFAQRALYERLLATALMNGETAASCENLGGSTAIKVFQTSHPANPLDESKGVYDNLYTGASAGTGEGTSDDAGVDNYPGALPLNATSIRIVRNLFGIQRGPNGVDPRGYDLTHIVVGKDLEETLLTLVKQDMIVQLSGTGATQTTTLIPNPLKKYKPIIPVINPYLTEAGVWYAVSADFMSKCPWMTLTKVPRLTGRSGSMPGPGTVLADGVEWIIDDESSELYKHGSKIGPAGSVAITPKVECGAAITWPWRIKRCKAT